MGWSTCPPRAARPPQGKGSPVSSGQGAGAPGYRGPCPSEPTEGVSSLSEFAGPLSRAGEPAAALPRPPVPEVKTRQDAGTSHGTVSWAGGSAGARGSWSRPPARGPWGFTEGVGRSRQTLELTSPPAESTFRALLEPNTGSGDARPSPGALRAPAVSGGHSRPHNPSCPQGPPSAVST